MILRTSWLFLSPMSGSYAVNLNWRTKLSIGFGFFGSGSGRACAWILKSFRASIGPDARAKLRFSVSFVIAGIKQREHLLV